MNADPKPDASLMIIFHKARQATLAILHDVSEAQARWLPNGEVNHILWHAGHIFVLLERCLFAATVGSDELPATIPDGWWPLFGWNSQPWTIAPNAWPSMAAVRQVSTSRQSGLNVIWRALMTPFCHRPSVGLTALDWSPKTPGYSARDFMMSCCRRPDHAVEAAI
ncbi:MAG: DinB family protein [Caldilineaceae bacterium]